MILSDLKRKRIPDVEKKIIDILSKTKIRSVGNTILFTEDDHVLLEYNKIRCILYSMRKLKNDMLKYCEYDECLYYDILGKVVCEMYKIEIKSVL